MSIVLLVSSFGACELQKGISAMASKDNISDFSRCMIGEETRLGNFVFIRSQTQPDAAASFILMSILAML
jgi:hypothetical protein